MANDAKKKILILGGGFGGIYTAMHLEKHLGREIHQGVQAEITLVNRDNFFLFTPMLHEVAASDLEPTNIVSPVRHLLKKVNFVSGEVQRINLDAKNVTVAHGFDGHAHDMPYDYLVIALGAVTNFYNTPGLMERALTMKTLGDAFMLRNRLIALLEEADSECAADQRNSLLTVVVAGGGFAGVETMGAINDFVRESHHYYRNVPKSAVRMVLVHAGKAILPELGEELGAYAGAKLRERGVEIFTGVKVTGANDQGVTLSNGMFIPARTVVWTAGVSPDPLVGTLRCPLDHGRIVVNEFLEVRNYPGVFALGDCAMVPNLREGGSQPPTAQHALREGKTCARNILADLTGGTRRPFTFSTLGQLATIGRRVGVAKIMGMKFSGWVAWFLWRSIYLSKLPRFEKKVRVAFDWTLDVLFPKDLVQYQTFRGKSMSGEEEAMEKLGLMGHENRDRDARLESHAAPTSV